jgi:hypothetical protein
MLRPHQQDAIHPTLQQRAKATCLAARVIAGAGDQQRKAMLVQAPLKGFHAGREDRIVERREHGAHHAAAP